MARRRGFAVAYFEECRRTRFWPASYDLINARIAVWPLLFMFRIAGTRDWYRGPKVRPNSVAYHMLHITWGIGAALAAYAWLPPGDVKSSNSAVVQFVDVAQGA